MKRMGIEALYRKPGTSKKHPGHKVYPYLMRGMRIDRANQVWALDTTYIPMAKGFVYLTAVVDWASRKVPAARIAITLEACHAVDVLQEAFTRHGNLGSLTPTRGASSLPRNLSGQSKTADASSAWMAGAPDGTTCLWNDCGSQSSTKKCVSIPMTQSSRPADRSYVISTGTTAVDHTPK